MGEPLYKEVTHLRWCPYWELHYRDFWFILGKCKWGIFAVVGNSLQSHDDLMVILDQCPKLQLCLNSIDEIQILYGF